MGQPRSLTENSARSEDGRKLRMKIWFCEENSELFDEQKRIFRPIYCRRSRAVYSSVRLLGGPPGQPSVLFEYDPSRSKEVPLRLFEGFSGYLQTDGYASYNAVCKQEGITQAGCFDHVRRKFTDAKKRRSQAGQEGEKRQS